MQHRVYRLLQRPKLRMKPVETISVYVESVFKSLVDKNLARVPRRSSNIAIVVTFAVVAVSWYFLEQPFLRMKRRFERRLQRVPAQVALAI